MKTNSTVFFVGLWLSSSLLAANGLNVGDVVAEQDFADYKGVEQIKSWSLVDNIEDQPDFSGKADFVQDGKIVFNALFTNKTIKAMLGVTGKLTVFYTKPEIRAMRSGDFSAVGDGLMCEPKLEVGSSRSYGVVSETSHVAELDSDLNGPNSDCNLSYAKEAANLRIRSLIPTIPGYKYKLEINHQKRTSENRMIVRFGDEYAEDTENPLVINITANRRYTRLVLKEKGIANTYGTLLKDIKVTFQGVDSDLADKVGLCEELFDPSQQPYRYRKCVNSDDSDTDLNPTLRVMKWVRGNGAIGSNPVRYLEENLFAGPGSHPFLSLGIKGRVVIRPTVEIDGKIQKVKMPIAGLTLSFDEITWGNHTFASYPEQGFVKVGLKGCLDVSINGSTRLANDLIDSSMDIKRRETIQTTDRFEFLFDTGVYAGCELAWVRIADRTNRLKHTPSTDGIDINNFRIE